MYHLIYMGRSFYPCVISLCYFSLGICFALKYTLSNVNIATPAF